jgi:hypothetical protein
MSGIDSTRRGDGDAWCPDNDARRGGDIATVRDADSIEVAMPATAAPVRHQS